MSFWNVALAATALIAGSCPSFAESAEPSVPGLTPGGDWYLVGSSYHDAFLLFTHQEPGSKDEYWQLLAYRNGRSFNVFGKTGTLWYELRLTYTNCRRKKEITATYRGYDIDGNQMFFLDSIKQENSVTSVKVV